MTPVQTLIEAGLTLETDGTRLVVSPTSGITDALRALIVANKPAIWADVYEAECQAAVLIASINRCCDARGDDDLNRAGLIDEAGNFTTHQVNDLIDHFNAEADRWLRATGQAP